MTIYHTYLSDSTESGLETIKGIQNDGSEFGVGISSDIVCNNISAEIITATQISGTIIGFSTLSAGYATAAGIATYASTAGIATYASTAGIATYASTAGIATYATAAGVSTSVIDGIASVTQLNVTGVSTLGVTSTTNLTTQQLNVSGITTLGVTTVTNLTSQQLNVSGITTLGVTTVTNLTSQQLNVSGIVTAAAYVATGTTAVYVGINTSTIDSNTTAFHYISYDTNNSAVNISNFGSGKKFEILARNTSGGNRTIIIRTSTTTSGHVAVPTLLSNGVAPVTNGTFNLSSGTGIYISVFNMNGTVAGYYA